MSWYDEPSDESEGDDDDLESQEDSYESPGEESLGLIQDKADQLVELWEEVPLEPEPVEAKRSIGILPKTGMAAVSMKAVQAFKNIPKTFTAMAAGAVAKMKSALTPAGLLGAGAAAISKLNSRKFWGLSPRK